MLERKKIDKKKKLIEVKLLKYICIFYVIVVVIVVKIIFIDRHKQYRVEIFQKIVVETSSSSA